MNDLFSMREEEIFQTLLDLKECKFVVIGGYAVNAYALPRFSVDCDIVIHDESEMNKIGEILKKRNYYRESHHNIPYSGNFQRYEKILDNNFKVSIGILITKVIDRSTGATFSAQWVFDNSTKMVLRGKTITEELKMPIIDIDALLAMKIISCRSTDIRDVFMIMPNAQKEEWIKSEISTRVDARERIKKMIEKVSSKQFKDGLAGVYGYVDEKVFQKHMKAILSLLEDKRN